MDKPEPILTELFYHDGRGPTLEKVHYFSNGIHIQATDYLNPDDNKNDIKHLKFIKPQAFQFTPEEEYNCSNKFIDWGNYNNAAILNLGKTEWFHSFSNRHSHKCNHFHIMFYDEVLDIICEGIEIGNGRYKNNVLNEWIESKLKYPFIKLNKEYESEIEHKRVTGGMCQYAKIRMIAFPNNEFEFDSEVSWPEENFNEIVKMGLLDSLISINIQPFLGIKIVLKEIGWHEVDSCKNSFYIASRKFIEEIKEKGLFNYS